MEKIPTVKQARAEGAGPSSWVSCWKALFYDVHVDLFQGYLWYLAGYHSMESFFVIINNSKL